MTEDYINGYKDGFVNGLDIKQNFKYQILGYDLHEILKIVCEYYDKQKSQTPDIPIGFSFNWNKRREINDFFTMLKNQGFKVEK